MLATWMSAISAIAAAQSAAAAQSDGANETEIAQFHGHDYVAPLRISADGTTVLSIFYYTDDSGKPQHGSYVWNKNAGMQGDPTGIFTGSWDVPQATAISGDGKYVVGSYSDKHSHQHIFRWSKAGGVQDLVALQANLTGSGLVVNSDGTVIAGILIRFPNLKHLDYAHFTCVAFRWTEAGGMKELGERHNMAVTAISKDGSILVGPIFDGDTADAAIHYFHWSQAGGFQDFDAGFVPASITADGKSIWGLRGNHLVRWTQGGFEDIADLGMTMTMTMTMTSLSSVSDDGTLVVGLYSESKDVNRIFTWTKAEGLRKLENSKWKTINQIAVSADGRVLAYDAIDTAGVMHQRLASIDQLVAQDRQAIEAKLAEQQARAQAAAESQARREAAAKAAAEIWAKANAEAEAKAKADAEAEAKAEEATAKAEAVGRRLIQAEAKRKEALLDARIEKVLTGGHPAQIYALAGDLEEEERPDLAAKLYQTLIDRYPDSPFAAKAIERKEAARDAARQQAAQRQAMAQQERVQQQELAAQQERTAQLELEAQQAAQRLAAQQQIAAQQQASPDQEQAIADCQTTCQSTYDSCQQNVSQKNGSALGHGIIGIMTKNAGAVTAAAEEASSGESSGDCSSAQSSCNESCQSQPEVAAAQQAARQQAYSDQMDQRNQAVIASTLSGAMPTKTAAAPAPVAAAVTRAQPQPQLRAASQPQTSAQTHTQAAIPAPTKVWPVPTRQWCVANPNSGNPYCAPVQLSAGTQNQPGGLQFAPELNRSSCVHEVRMDFGRALQNDCSVPVNVAYCSFGPANDGMQCTASTGSVGTSYAISTINSIRSGGYASDPSGLAKQNHMAYFACANDSGKVQAVLTGYDPPQGTCVRY
jgi:hypothetical protein